MYKIRTLPNVLASVNFDFFVLFMHVNCHIFTDCSCFCFRPDGTKKAYVRLTPDYDALDVANKIGII